MKARYRVRTKGTNLPIRAAIYTRKSVTEGLDQEFNSLDAQRQSVEHYVASHAAQGWVALTARYDDGGFSGATIERPAFQRLLADIEAGQVDVVAVYRLDRLSRSLLDFAQLMKLFEESGVAFVSVTEHFDTSTAMGRMVLNMVATFAQFERESTAQRTRDKVHAARRRGMWTGGKPLLGYDVKDKKLVVNQDEAARVRDIFGIYLHEGSLLATADELQRRGWGNKSWTNEEGRRVEGQAFNRSSLHTLLRCPLFAGRIRAGDELVAAQHTAIVDDGTWQAVQDQLDAGAPEQPRRPYRPKSNAGLLQGLVRCGVCGSSFSYTYAGSKRRWSYLICAKAAKHGAKACPGSRVAAGEFEQFIFDRIRAIGRDRAVLNATLDACPSKTDPAELRTDLRELDGIWAELFPAERARVLALLIEQITFTAATGDVQIHFREGAPNAITKP